MTPKHIVSMLGYLDDPHLNVSVPGRGSITCVPVVTPHLAQCLWHMSVVFSNNRDSSRHSLYSEHVYLPYFVSSTASVKKEKTTGL